jgi:hypothetical protein
MNVELTLLFLSQQYNVWTGITISAAFLELLNVLGAVRILYGVRMPWRAKVAVLSAFIIRLL